MMSSGFSLRQAVQHHRQLLERFAQSATGTQQSASRIVSSRALNYTRLLASDIHTPQHTYSQTITDGIEVRSDCGLTEGTLDLQIGVVSPKVP